LGYSPLHSTRSRQQAKATVLESHEATKVGFAETRCCFNDGVNDGLKIKLRAADDTKDVTSRCLEFERLLQLALACLLCLKQSRVLDGDHGLVGKGLEKLDLSLRKGPWCRSRYRDTANRNVMMHHRHGDNCARGDAPVTLYARW